MKGLLSKSAALVMGAALLLTGCGAGNTSQKESAKEDVTLKMLVPGYDGGYLKEQLDNGIADFEKENPGVKVQIVSVGWEELNSKIIQLYQSKEAPDIMLTGTRSLKQLGDMGAVEDLSKYMTDDFKSKRVENVLNTANIDGKQYGIPMAFSSRALYYRTDLVKKAPTTWDELLQTAKDVHKANPKVYGFAIPTDMQSGTDELLNFVYQNDGRITNDKGEFTLNSDANVETLEYLKKFNQDGVIPDPVSTKRDEQSKLFKNGNLAMYISGTWEKETMDSGKEKAPYAVAPLPAGKVKAENLVTDSYVVSSLSKNKDMAWKFIEFMGQPKYQRSVSEAFNWFPILKEEENDDRFKSDFMKPFADSIQYGVPEAIVPNWDDFNKAFITAVQKTLTDKSSAKDALDSAQTELSK